jgi:hypothetical protein
VSSSPLIVAGRVLLLGIAAGAVVLGFVLTRGDDDAGAIEVAVTYVCPMHPEVTSQKPGSCPICRMALEPKKAEPEPSALDTHDSTFELEQAAALRSFHDVTRAKQYTTSREMRVPASIEKGVDGVALLHHDEIELLERREAGLFFASTPQRGAKAGIEGLAAHLADEPPVKWDDATALVRFRLDAPSADFRAHQTGWLKLAARIRVGLVVPYAAVLQSQTGPYVLAVGDDRRSVTKRSIGVGSVLFGYAAVTSGLADGDRVAAMNTFFLDAERRTKERFP